MDITEKTNEATIKITGLLNLALRAGNLVLGVDNIRRSRKVRAVIADAGLADGSVQRLVRYAAERSMPLYLYAGELADLVYKQNCRAVGISDGNIWKGMSANILNLAEFKIFGSEK